MTIVTTYSRETFPNDQAETAEQYCADAAWSNADITAINRDVFDWSGSLWERIAEATPKILGPAYTQRLMDATLNAYIRSGERQSILYGLTSIDDE